MDERVDEEVSLRAARSSDAGEVAGFTTATFPWGDYVGRVFEDWLSDESGAVFVAVDRSDRPIGLGRVALLSPREAWLQGIRVHPGRRRLGVAARLTNHLAGWALDRGARVARLLVEGWNQPARNLVESCAFRPIGRWYMAERHIGDASPVPAGNGGKRVPALEKLRRAPASEAEPAYIAWVGGEASHAARELWSIGWTWRRLTAADLAGAGERGALYEARCGWAIAESQEGTLRTGWFHTDPTDGVAMARALVDLAGDVGAERLEVMLPGLPWLVRAFRQAGTDLSDYLLYARTLGPASR